MKTRAISVNKIGIVVNTVVFLSLFLFMLPKANAVVCPLGTHYSYHVPGCVANTAPVVWGTAVAPVYYGTTNVYRAGGVYYHGGSRYWGTYGGYHHANYGGGAYHHANYGGSAYHHANYGGSAYHHAYHGGRRR